MQRNQPDQALSSSLRTRTAEESLAIVELLAPSRGITRVVDTTWLDRIGIPVYASIRPNAHRATLAVNAGKGFTHAEAKIGAYMEALEFSFASSENNRVPHRLAKPQEILDSFRGGLRFVEFAPLLGRKVKPTDDIAVVCGQELLSGKGQVLIPAETAYHLFVANPGVTLYGTSTNGLASGNTLLEATAHATAEVMERHVSSHLFVDDTSMLVDTTEATPKIRDMVQRIEDAGLKCYLRYVENDFKLPYFTAYVLEPDEYSPVSVAGGQGFHPNREIAAIRALAEAVQSRLTFIHGGRDDIITRYDWQQRVGPDAALQCARAIRSAAARDTTTIAFYDTPSAEVQSIQRALDVMFDALRGVGLNHVVRVQFTDDDYPFQVVKVVIPGAEFYDVKLKRVGPRLMEFIKKVKAKREDEVAHV